MLEVAESTLAAVTTFTERLNQAFAASGRTRAELAAALRGPDGKPGISVQAVGQQLSGSTKQMTAENVALAARFLGCDVHWLATGEGQPTPPGVIGVAVSASSAQPLGSGMLGFPGDRPVSDPPLHDAPLLTWGDVMQATHLPDLFWLELTDDAMAPRARAGKRMGFSRTELVKGGAGVLVRDRGGKLHFRQYLEGAAGQWIARATNPGFLDLHSDRDGLELVAVLIAEWGGWH